MSHLSAVSLLIVASLGGLVAEQTVSAQLAQSYNGSDAAAGKWMDSIGALVCVQKLSTS